MTEAFEDADVAFLVAGLVDGGFGDEGGVGKAGVVEEAAEGLDADGSLPYVIMTVEF